MELRTEVLVVGAGLGGLSASLFLAQRGVNVLTVDRHASTAFHPRATGQSWRTMELFRFAGIDTQVLEATKRTTPGLHIAVAPTLSGPVTQRMTSGDVMDVGAATPVPLGMAGQDAVEPIMVAAAVKFGADVRFGTELVSFEQDSDSVIALIRDTTTGEETTVRAEYLVAADGNRSPIREKYGIDFTGVGGLKHSIGVVFDADLGDHLPLETYEVYLLQNEQFEAMILNTEVPGRFIFGLTYHPDRGETPEDFTHERLADLIRFGTDMPDLKPEIVSVAPWEIAARIATSFRAGRVFLVGDAAKVTPPAGGQGGNTAIADGHNLAWKLADVLRNGAGDALLDTYEAERRPIAKLVVDNSTDVLTKIIDPQVGLQALDSVLSQVDMVLGFQYRSTAVLSEDDDQSLTENPLAPSGRPGFRTPDGDGLSLVDLVGDGWLLLTRGDGWYAAAEECGLASRIIPALGPAYREATLVRPDGIVAWRTGEVAGSAASLRLVLDQVLSRQA